MIILIDGYNLLKQLFTGHKQILDAQKAIFLRQLSAYKQLKIDTTLDIIIVFDGGPSTHATRLIKNGITIIQSGTKQSADDWIIDFTVRNKNKAITVVTLDRALKNATKFNNADSMDVHIFYTLMTGALQTSHVSITYKTDNNLTVYENIDLDDMINPYKQHADSLMTEASLFIDKKEETYSLKPRAGNGQSLSKTEKQFVKKIKKLS